MARRSLLSIKHYFHTRRLIAGLCLRCFRKFRVDKSPERIGFHQLVNVLLSVVIQLLGWCFQLRNYFFANAGADVNLKHQELIVKDNILVVACVDQRVCSIILHRCSDGYDCLRSIYFNSYDFCLRSLLY